RCSGVASKHPSRHTHDTLPTTWSQLSLPNTGPPSSSTDGGSRSTSTRSNSDPSCSGSSGSHRANTLIIAFCSSLTAKSVLECSPKDGHRLTLCSLSTRPSLLCALQPVLSWCLPSFPPSSILRMGPHASMVRALPHTLSHPTMSSNSTEPSSSGSYVSLMGQALAPTTHSKYTKALTRFEAFCDDQGFEVHRNRDVDRILTLYVQHLHDSGGSMDLAKNTIYAVQHRAPWLAHSLGAAKLALRGWHRTHPSNSHPPLTWELTCLMAVWMAIRGQHHAALAMLVGFDCYLRIGELLSLKVQDVAVSNDPRLGSAYRGVLLRLAHTKTGRNQAVTVEDSAVADMLTSHIQARGPSRTQSDLVFQVSRDSFYKLFHGACRAFGL